MTPDLTEKFLPPIGWRTHSFTNPDTGHDIHFGSVFPQGDTPATAIVVCLPGLSEFSEKYYEVAHDMLARGYAFWCIDWHYQGRSGRMKKFPHRRHSDGVESDLSDLHQLIKDYIKPASVHRDKGRTPLIMLAHSMGGNIGLRYLAAHPEVFSAAAFSAPLLGIYKFSWAMEWLAKLLSCVPFINCNYVPKGKDWYELKRKGDGSDIFSSDPMRDTLHGTWSKSDEHLQVGDPTIRWVAEMLKSFAALRKSGVLESITIPVVLGLAQNDTIIDNKAIQTAASRLPNAELVEICDARHEILMEQDCHRDTFFAAFDKMLKEHKISSDNH